MPPIQTFVDSSLQIPTKGRPKWSRHVKDGDPLSQLSLGVPTPQHVKKDREEGAFEEADQEPERIELADIMHACLRKSPYALHLHRESQHYRTRSLNSRKASPGS